MSGYLAIVNTDGSPADHALLRHLTSSLSFRGPDAQRIWCKGPIGFGHALLRTTFESAAEHQPMSLDDSIWIVADARVDARRELIAALAGHGTGAAQPVSAYAPDVELILRAYIAWGEECVHRLLGDFSFVIWNTRERRLFAARDHFGVKPLFYAEFADKLLVSNTLNCLRFHPSISAQPNERFIGDFLLTGVPQDTAITAFADIARLPAAHTLTLNTGIGAATSTPRLLRYWTLPIEEPLRYKRESDYVEQFRGLLRDAVRDRLRTDRVSISISGGLDSPSVAAMACSLFRGKPTEFRGRARGDEPICTGATNADPVADAIRGVTMVYERVIPDRERYFSGVVGRHLGFPIDYVVAERYPLFDGCNDSSLCNCEPLDFTIEAAIRERFKLAAAHGRVLLTGEGGDPGLIPSLEFYRGRLPSLGWQIARYLFLKRTLPRAGFRLMFDRWRGKPATSSPYPAWLEPGFEARAGLRDRWREINAEPAETHPDRPSAYASVTSPFWSYVLNYYEPTSLAGTVEVRHPLFDLRLMRFLLRLPTLPWCAEKEMIRRGIRGLLPDEILRRPKTPLAGDPVEAMLGCAESCWIDRFVGEPELSKYVMRDRVPALTGASTPPDSYVNLLPISLNYWLRHKGRFGYTLGNANIGNEETYLGR